MDFPCRRVRRRCGQVDRRDCIPASLRVPASTDLQPTTRPRAAVAAVVPPDQPPDPAVTRYTSLRCRRFSVRRDSDGCSGGIRQRIAGLERRSSPTPRRLTMCPRPTRCPRAASYVLCRRSAERRGDREGVQPASGQHPRRKGHRQPGKRGAFVPTRVSQPSSWDRSRRETS